MSRAWKRNSCGTQLGCSLSHLFVVNFQEDKSRNRLKLDAVQHRRGRTFESVRLTANRVRRAAESFGLTLRAHQFASENRTLFSCSSATR